MELLVEPGHLLRCQKTPLPFFQAAQLEASLTDTLEFLDMIMKQGKNPSDLALTAFVDRHLQFFRCLPDNTARRCLLALQKNALADLTDIAVFGVPIQNHSIYFLHFIRRVTHLVRQFPVVGQQEKPGRVLIQAAHGMQPASEMLRDEFQDGLGRMGIADSAHRRLGLMEKKINFPGELDDAAVKTHLVRRWMDVARGLGDLFAVDSHAAALDRLKGLTPGTDAGMRQEYLQTHKTTA